MSRPGLDPGTLRLKVGCGWSERSGGVGSVRESKELGLVVSALSGGVVTVRGIERGIFERDRHRQRRRK